MTAHEDVVARVAAAILKTWESTRSSAASQHEADELARAIVAAALFPAGVLTLAKHMGDRVEEAWSTRQATRLVYTIHVGAHHGQLRVTLGREETLPLDRGRATAPQST